ncbi:glycerate kinase type-2 family protein [Halorubrum sp. HHNYT27]|uniref:glycerate kinase type-2 family protein n=1 Tax=Halorubrum sp. HHNYT27 TaxID=3402275 RepID=UPI003EBF1AE3
MDDDVGPDGDVGEDRAPGDATGVTFRDRERLARTPGHGVALDCLAAGIAAARPDRLIPSAVSVRDGVLRIEGVETGADADAVGEYDLVDYDRVALLGAGKAAAEVAAALTERFEGSDRGIDEGVVVTEDPGSRPSPPGVEVLPGDHPLPSDEGVESARRVLDLAERAGPGDLVLAVITGGGSALLAAPADPITPDDLRELTEGLLASGASIDEINAVRKHCSAVKGGLLARAAAPATVVTLAISDVIGDPLDAVASGPTVPDPTTYAEALAVLDRYDLDAPTSVRERLRAGADGELAETPTADDPAFERARAFVVGNGRTALDAAAAAATERGYESLVLAAGVRGEARGAGTTHAAIAEECAARGSPAKPPAVLLSGGETTVTLGDADGTGGPNAEFAASAGLALAEGPLGGSDAGGGRRERDAPRVVVASADTDGIDGPTDAAGGIVDATTLDPDAARDALDRHDVYPLLDEAGALLRTGPTGTNVNDLRVLVIGAPDRTDEP